VDEFGVVEVKHESRYLASNLLFAHQAQQVYYVSYPHASFKNWWVVYKARLEMHTCRYYEDIEGHEDDDIYQKENKIGQNFMVSDEPGLAELDTDDVELLDEEVGPLKKRLQKSKRLLE
jgi:hypothetical protein